MLAPWTLLSGKEAPSYQKYICRCYLRLCLVLDLISIDQINQSRICVILWISMKHYILNHFCDVNFRYPWVKWIECGTVITRSIFSKILTTYTPYLALIARYRVFLRVVFILNSNSCSELITTVRYVISCNIGPRYNGTRQHRFGRVYSCVGIAIY